MPLSSKPLEMANSLCPQLMKLETSKSVYLPQRPEFQGMQVILNKNEHLPRPPYKTEKVSQKV